MCRSIFRNYKAWMAVLLTSTVFLAWPRPNSGSSQEQKKADIDALMKQWEKDVREQMEKTASLKALAAKYPLVVLHSRALYAGGGYLRSGYDFVLETSDPSKHINQVQLTFHNGGEPCNFIFAPNLLVDLAKWDFSKDPDPLKISIDDPSVLSTLVEKPVVGHVYLQRIHDDWGNHFYVLFQVVAVDKDSRYMAFIWRRLPGGKLVKERLSRW